MRLLHLADVHLGASMSSFGDLAEGRRRQLLDAFRALPAIAEQEDAQAVLVAGDLFDRPEPGAEAVAAAAETFARLEEAGRPVFVVPGNHDSSTLHHHPYAEPLGGARVFLSPDFERQTVETAAGDLHVYGLADDVGRQDEPVSTWERADLAGVHVALLHGSVEFSPHWKIGKNALRLPPHLHGIIKPGPGHRSGSNRPYLSAFTHWLDGWNLEPRRLYGEPLDEFDLRGRLNECAPLPPSSCAPRRKKRRKPGKPPLVRTTKC